MDEELQHVAIWVCKACLSDEPGECHSPGCIQFLRGDIPDQLGERLEFKHRYEATDDLSSYTRLFSDFAKTQGWGENYSPDALAKCITLEASELLEHFQWLSAEQSKQYVGDPDNRRAVSWEAVDILFYLLIFAENSGIDWQKAISDKLVELASRRKNVSEKKLKPIPVFKNEQEEREFWQTHSSTDYVDWGKAEVRKAL